jgi:hypothetical protein
MGLCMLNTCSTTELHLLAQLTFKMFLQSGGVVAQVCSPSYSGGRDWRTIVWGQQRQKVSKTPSQAGRVVQACNPSYLGVRDREYHYPRAAQAKKLVRLPPQPMARYSGMLLSFQLCRKAQLGGSARRQWLTPIIQATQEAEIRRIAVRSQLKQIVHKTLS